jgi:hypothetical protein
MLQCTPQTAKKLNRSILNLTNTKKMSKDIINYLSSDIVEPAVYIIKLKKTYTGAAQEYGYNKGNVTLNETPTAN